MRVGRAAGVAVCRSGLLVYRTRGVRAERMTTWRAAEFAVLSPPIHRTRGLSRKPGAW